MTEIVKEITFKVPRTVAKIVQIRFNQKFFKLFQNIINYSSIPKQLLLVQTVDQKRFMQFDVFPCHQIRKTLRIKTDHRIHLRPQLHI